MNQNNATNAQNAPSFKTLTTSKDAQAIKYFIDDGKLTKKRKEKLIQDYGGFTAFKKNNFIKYKTIFNDYKYNIIFYLCNKDNENKKLNRDIVDKADNLFKSLYKNETGYRADRVKYSIINADGGYMNFNNGIKCIEKNRLFIISSNTPFIGLTEQIIEIKYYIKYCMKQEEILTEYHENAPKTPDYNALYSLKKDDRIIKLLSFDDQESRPGFEKINYNISFLK